MPNSYSSMTDIQDAIEHAKEVCDNFELLLNDFTISHINTSIKALRNLDDLSSWPEWSFGELLNLTPDEVYSELVSFRGEEWANRATTWITKSGKLKMPPIVIVLMNECEGTSASFVGDGRGRVSLAIGLGYEDKISAIFLSQK